MPVEVTVGPPALTINQGSTFMVTDLKGEIAANSEQGLFSGDTRFVSYFRLFANGLPWQCLSSSTVTYYAARLYFTNPPLATEEGEIAGGQLALALTRAVGDGVHEDLDVTNYGLGPVRFNLEIALRSDFADLFEVKAHAFVRRGRIESDWHRSRRELRVRYTNRDFHRELIYRVAKADSPPHVANGRVTWELVLAPGASWHACCYYILVEGDRVRTPAALCDHASRDSALDRLHREWKRRATALTSSNEDVYRLFRQSVEDLGALRLSEPDAGPDVWFPAAGVPWFVTVFGRDSLIVSHQTMIVDPGFARGTLRTLAAYQAAGMDDWRDAEPGKILHEIRFGELAHFHKIPHTPYYGTADATILYLIVLHEAWKWLGDAALLQDHRAAALRCLEWIDRYGDLDGDGFQEYRTRSPQGYENMGWKDAGDAVVYPDGRQVAQPKALCELQGYVFDAWMRMAEVFEAWRDPAGAAALRAKAAALRDRFEARFWCEDLGCYAFALDPDKRPVETVASNAGHCLWSGIASPGHAARVVRRLLEPDMWSGWGVRTLSARHPAYNPLSYQRGSVWPHDNGIIALGFKRYGFAAEAARVFRDVSEAASYFAGYRLPELYAGIERRPGTFPVLYPAANVPQAWAAGSVFHFLRAVLGLDADAPNRRLYVDPVLPPWLAEVSLQQLKVGGAAVGLRFWRADGETRWEVTAQEGEVEVRARPWMPWSVPAPAAPAAGGGDGPADAPP
jgi:glycogen debranching enzyme